MAFFTRILQEPADVAGRAIVRKERRDVRRLAIDPEFPLKAVLSFDRHGGTVAPMGNPQGWDWPGRLINCSEVGARIRLGPAALAVRGDFCELRLSLEGFALSLPTRITNVRVERDGVYFGLKHGLDDEATRSAHRQLFEVVALGATLRPQSRKSKPDDSGYLVEPYAGDDSRLTVWREPSDRKVAAFEFLLKDCLVRAARGRAVEYRSGSDAANASQATPAMAEEIRRLFGWVLTNLAPAVPVDVRDFLRQSAA